MSVSGFSWPCGRESVSESSWASGWRCGTRCAWPCARECASESASRSAVSSWQWRPGGRRPRRRPGGGSRRRPRGRAGRGRAGSRGRGSSAGRGREQDEGVELGPGGIGRADADRGGDGEVVHGQVDGAAGVGAREDGGAEEVRGVAHLEAVAGGEDPAHIHGDRVEEVPVVDDDVGALGLVGVGPDEDLHARRPRRVVGVARESPTA